MGDQFEIDGLQSNARGGPLGFWSTRGPTLTALGVNLRRTLPNPTAGYGMAIYDGVGQALWSATDEVIQFAGHTSFTDAQMRSASVQNQPVPAAAGAISTAMIHTSPLFQVSMGAWTRTSDTNLQWRRHATMSTRRYRYTDFAWCELA